jgi:hypothetical protein
VQEEDDDSNVEAPLVKFKRGEEVPSDFEVSIVTCSWVPSDPLVCSASCALRIYKNWCTYKTLKDKTLKDKTLKDKTLKDKTSKDKTSKDKTSKDKTSITTKRRHYKTSTPQKVESQNVDSAKMPHKL